MKTRKIILWIFILVAVDQIIKIFINLFFLENHFEIIPSLIEFKPIFNDKHSYLNVLLNNKFNIDIGLFAHLISFLILEIIVLSMYSFFRKNISKYKKLLDTAFIFQISGLICALIGNLIWKKGTLDYLYLIPLFVFDLKDLYNNVFVILFLIYTNRNINEIKILKIKDMVSHIGNVLKKNN